MSMNLSGGVPHNALWTPPTKELIYISIGLREEQLDRFVDLCCHHDDDPIIPSWHVMYHADHALASLGLIDIVSYDSPVSLRITNHGKEIFEDLKKYDPVSLVNSCIRQKAWWTALYFMQFFLSISQLPEFLAHDTKEIRDLAAKRLDVLTSYRDAV